MRFEGDGFVAFVHREIVAGTPVPGAIRFAFGALGWCRVVLGEEGGDR